MSSVALILSHSLFQVLDGLPVLFELPLEMLLVLDRSDYSHTQRVKSQVEALGGELRLVGDV